MLAKKLHKHLIDDGIINATGSIKFDLLGINTSVKTRGVVGDIIQEWLEGYIANKNIQYDLPSNTQAFPDFYLKDNNSMELLEIKCFNHDASANFDISNFQAYCTSLLDNPNRLDSNYLIFSYQMNQQTGDITIKDVWLKKVWEICGRSEDWPIKLQVKKGVIYNIRPITWYSTRARYTPFNNKAELLEALDSTLKRYTTTHSMWRDKWLETVKSKYKHLTGKEID